MKLMHDLVGHALGERYLLVARIAGGGMGEVYRARDLLLDRKVAVKVLRSVFAADPDVVARFRAEARAVARLVDPNVAQVYDWGEEGDIYYMVMEFVEGSDLRDVLVGRGALEPGQAVEIVASVCSALAAAHDAGVVHRDIKPENVLIARDGTVKVVDFGVAAFADHERETGSGFSGTFRYLAPEQLQGMHATPASDVWAAGALLAELLTGRRPTPGAHSASGNGSRMWPSALIPRALDAILVSACAPDPSERFASAGAMAHALRRVLVRSLPTAAPVATLLEEVTHEIDLRPLEPTLYMNRAQKRRRRKTKRRLAVVGIVFVLLGSLTLGATQAVPLLGGEGRVGVPELTGLTTDDAIEVADTVGLETLVVRRVRSPLAGRGRIVSQDPAGGLLGDGDLIKLVVSAGPPPPAFVGIVGGSLDSALVRFEVGGIDVGTITREHSPAPEGTVLERSPSDTRLRPGTTVDLVVSKGPAPVVVPPVTGMTRAAAISVLRGNGLAVVSATEYSDDVPPGAVIRLDPAAGTKMAEGDAVTVYVSTGPRYNEVKVPDLDGWGIDEARARLQELGLEAKIVESCDGSGARLVVDSDPIAGSKVREHDLVALFVC